MLEAKIKLNNSAHLKLKNIIDKKGDVISAHDFIDFSLYDAEFGYYSSNINDFGSNGDFITAPLLGNIFANSIVENIKKETNFRKIKILEIGAGNGKLCSDLLSLSPEIEEYYIVDKSRKLRSIQKKNLQYDNKVKWIDEIPLGFEGIIIANEVLDALPCHVFHYQNTFLEIVIRHDRSKFYLDLSEPSTKLYKYLISNNIENYLLESQSYISEVNLNISPWLQNIKNRVTRCKIMLFDYGYLRSEYYRADRVSGTLISFKNHKINTNWLENIGKQDISAFVDFTEVLSSAEEIGFSKISYSTLSNFLVENNIEKFWNKDNADEIRILTSPTEMGELIKSITMELNN